MSNGPLNSPGVRIILNDQTIKVSSTGSLIAPDPFRAPILAASIPPPALTVEWDPDSITEDGGMSSLIPDGGTPPYTYEFEWVGGHDGLEFTEDGNEVTVNVTALNAEWTVADFDTTSLYLNTSFDPLVPGFITCAMYFSGGTFEPSESIFLTPTGGTGPYVYDLSAVPTGNPTDELVFVDAGGGEFYIDYVNVDGSAALGHSFTVTGTVTDDDLNEITIYLVITISVQFG